MQNGCWSRDYRPSAARAKSRSSLAARIRPPTTSRTSTADAIVTDLPPGLSKLPRTLARGHRPKQLRAYRDSDRLRSAGGGHRRGLLPYRLILFWLPLRPRRNRLLLAAARQARRRRVGLVGVSDRHAIPFTTGAPDLPLLSHDPRVGGSCPSSGIACRAKSRLRSVTGALPSPGPASARPGIGSLRHEALAAGPALASGESRA